MTNFKFRNKHSALSDGLSMGSPASPVIANIYMKALEERALSTFELGKPKIWYRYVGNVFSITKGDTHSETTPTPQQPISINSFHRGVKERREICRTEDRHVHLSKPVLWKPTHSSRCLQYASNYTDSSKRSVAHQARSFQPSETCDKKG